jgi:hypothetical protein
VGVAVLDDRDRAIEMADELRPTYPVGIDPTGKLRDLYVGPGMPVTFIIAPSGLVVTQINGPVTARQLGLLVDELNPT